jgi:hypothetical protein
MSKPANIAVGQVWTWGLDNYDVVFIGNDGAVLRSRKNKSEWFHKWSNWTGAKLVVPKKKIYTMLWKHSNGATNPVCCDKLEQYENIKRLFPEGGYTLVKEWELEYDAESPSN